MKLIVSHLCRSCVKYCLGLQLEQNVQIKLSLGQIIENIHNKIWTRSLKKAKLEGTSVYGRYAETPKHTLKICC